MKKQLFILLVALLAIGQSAFTPSAWAYDGSVTLIGGQTIYYNYNNSTQTIEITHPGDYSWDSWNGYTKPTGSLVIPDSIMHNSVKCPVTSIGDLAFLSCSGLTSITIPSSITSIGQSAFSGCSGLTSVTIPSSVTSIGNYAFWECTSLTSVNYTGTIAQWCSIVFSNMDSNPIRCAHLLTINGNPVTNLVIPDGVTSIGNFTFDNCWNLTSVIIPNSVTSIGLAAFRGCISLTSITIDSGITSIGNYAFQNCSSLTSVIIPSSVTSIGNRAFEYCSGLTSATIGNSVTSIAEATFADCSSLSSVTIGSGVASIGNYAFLGCGLDSVYMMPPTPPSLASSVFSNNALEMVFILNGCTYDNYYTTNTSNPWYQYRNALRDPIYDITVTLFPNDITRGSASIIQLRERDVRCDSTAVISATANNNYHFDHWSNGSTSSLDTIVLTGDSTLTAYFIGLTVTSSNTSRGTASRTKIGDHLEKISATANSSYHFDHWSNGSTANPDTIALTGDSTVIAYFVGLTVTSSNTSRGTASRTKIGDHIEEITATPNYGYHFDHWSNGSTANPDTITLTGDSTVTAHFEKNQYTLTLAANDALLGTTSGAGDYLYLDNVTISATCTADHYHFVCWSDWETANPRTVTITENISLTAIFAIDTLYVDARANDDDYGMVYGGGYYPYGSTVTLQAVPNEGHLFMGWSNDTTNNPYTITVEDDYSVEASFTPYCVPSICMVSVQSNHNLLIWDDNSVESDINIYREGAIAGDYDQVATIPYGHGTQWIDEESNPRSHSYRYKITASDQYGNETPSSDVHKTMLLTINKGQGNNWNLIWTEYEGATYSSYQIYRGSNPNDIELIDQFSADGNTTYADYDVNLDTVYYQVAILKDEPCNTTTKSLSIIRSNIATNGTMPIGIEDVDTTHIKVYAIDGHIVVEGATDEVHVYDMMGRLTQSFKQSSNQALPTGVYLVKIGDLPARRVVVIR